MGLRGNARVKKVGGLPFPVSCSADQASVSPTFGETEVAYYGETVSGFQAKGFTKILACSESPQQGSWAGKVKPALAIVSLQNSCITQDDPGSPPLTEAMLTWPPSLQSTNMTLCAKGPMCCDDLKASIQPMVHTWMLPCVHMCK